MRLMWFKTLTVTVFVLCGVAFGQAIAISGRVVDYAGTPVRHRILTLSAAGRENLTAETDENGRFHFQSVEGNKSAHLVANATGFAATPIDLDVLTRGGDIGTLVLQPDRPVALGGARRNGSMQTLLSGRISNADGSPYAQKIVNFSCLKRAKRSQPGSVAFSTLMTDGSGRFVFPAASGHEYEVYVPQYGAPLTFKAIGKVAVVAGGDLDLGDIVLQVRSGQEAVGELLGPVKVFDSATTKSKPAPAQIAAVFSGAGGIVTIVHGDGKLFRPPKENEQVGSSSRLISDDNQAAGWLVGSDFCCTSYPLHFMLVVYRPGQPLRRFKGDGRAIFGWNFVGGGKQVAFFQSYPHGNPAMHYELRDVATEKLIGKWDGDVTSRAPQWVRAFGN